MNKQVRDTSIEAYNTLSSFLLGERQRKVYEAIKELNEHGIYPTDREIQQHLGWQEPNMVRPRRKELEDMGLIIAVGKRKCTVTGKKAYTWMVVK